MLMLGVAFLVVESLHEVTLIAQRIVSDGVKSAGGVTFVNVEMHPRFTCKIPRHT